jgi:xanthine dehydrogenase YagS FAD-binding subunit
MLREFSYRRVDSLEEAVHQSIEPNHLLMAGGSDLLTFLREGVQFCDMVVSLSGLDDLKTISTVDGGLAIGALVTIAEIATHSDVQRLYPVLAQAAAAVASPQIRNQGTLGGNLCQKPRCWYWRNEAFDCLRKGGDTCFALGGQNQFHAILGGDMCVYVHPSDTAPALVALDATLNLVGPDGERSVPAEHFFVLPSDDPTVETVLAPGEIVTEVAIPAPPDGAVSRYRKVRSRDAWDFALASIALNVELSGDLAGDVRIALGGVAPIPWRAVEAEAVVRGERLTPEVAARAADAAVADAYPLEHNGAKVAIVKGIVEAELLSLVQTE